MSDTMPLSRFPLMPVDQIEQREQKNPHNIDEVPIQTHKIDGGTVFGIESPLKRLLDQPNQEAGADNHVQRVQPGHRKVQGEKELRVSVGANGSARLEIEVQARNVVFDEFLVIFDALDAKKHAAEDQGQDQEDRDELLFAYLCSPDRHCHGQTAANENDGVDRAQRQVDGAAGLAENLGIRRPVERVGHEHAAEEQNFGDQEHPHP